MDDGRGPVRLGLLATAAYFLLLALPYGYARASSIGTYYGVGATGPAFVGLLLTIATIALLSGATDRSDPALAAGVAVAVSFLATILAAGWALPAGDVVPGMPIPAWFEFHPPAIVLSAGLLAVASGLFARQAV